MTYISSEFILTRALAYLRTAGVPMTRQFEGELLRLIGEALADPGDETMGYVMERLPKRFPLTSLPAIKAVPPMQRGSVGYPSL